MKKYVFVFVLIFSYLTPTNAQTKKTACKITTSAGEEIKGFLKRYDVETYQFPEKNLKIQNENGKSMKFNLNHILLFEVNDVVYKPRVNAKSERRFMKVMKEDEQFSVYVDYVGKNSAGMQVGFYRWLDYHYYFRKDDTTFQLPYHKLKINPATYFETVDELIFAMRRQARVKNVVLPEYLANYKKSGPIKKE